MTSTSAPVLDPALLAGLAMAARRDVRRNGNVWGIPSAVASELVRDRLIIAAVAHDSHNPDHTWPVWRITRSGRQALAAADGAPE